MSECIDTISSTRPIEGFTTWVFQGALWLARKGDAAVVTAVNAALNARARAAQRHMLSALDERMLRDLGLSRADVEAEVTKPFWKV